MGEEVPSGGGGNELLIEGLPVPEVPSGSRRTSDVLDESVPAYIKCKHGRRRVQCKDCMGSQICTHLRQIAFCKECGGKGICTHGRVKYSCKDCGGSQVCPHGRIRYRCKDCGGKGICEHHKQKHSCKDCRDLMKSQ